LKAVLYILKKLYRWQYIWLCLIVLATLVLHFVIIAKPTSLILDEQHYVKEARNIIENHDFVFREHPPLGKLFITAGEYIFSGFKSPVTDTGTTTQQAIIDSTDNVIDVSDASVFSIGKTIKIDNEQMYVQSVNTELNQLTVERGYIGTTATSHTAQRTIYVFNDNPLGWRFFPIILGTGGIVLFYFICRKLNMSNRAASIATFLLAFENMTFIQNSVAMLDVFLFFFMMAAFLLYLTRKYFSAGIAAGLSALSKLMGAMAVPAMIIHWFFSRVNRSRWFAVTVALSAITFVVLLPVLEYIVTHHFENPYDRMKDMLSLTSSLTFANTTHVSMAQPWWWVFWYKTMPYFYSPNYISAVSPSVFVLIVPAFAYMIYRAVKRDEAGLFGAAWFFSTYVLWIPLVLITDRITYPFYFYPTVGAVCLGAGMGISQLIDIFKGRRSGKLKWTILGIIVVIFLAHIVFFMILYPLFPINLYEMFG
jgi:predicted membrane-bound dolichyl-phosphate-mannose-protein mannosyltransferase